MKKMVIKMNWDDLSPNSQMVVTNRTMAAMRIRCLRCRKCQPNDLAWKVKVETKDGVDIWYMECPVTGIKVITRYAYALINGRLRPIPQPNSP